VLRVSRMSTLTGPYSVTSADAVRQREQVPRPELRVVDRQGRERWLR
jgi:hypothetical protein